MTTPPAPGWYPNPHDPSRNQYWDGRTWHRDGPPASPQPASTTPKPKRKTLFWVILLVAGLWLASQCTSTKTENTSGSSSSSSSSTPARTSETPAAYEFMPGNGTHEMGGVDGKNWGTWESDGTTGVTPGTNCTWSIRSVAPNRGGEILEEGQTPSGQPATVNIQPDGGVSTFDGTIGDDNHRIVFMTNNCGAWKPKS